MCRIDFLGTGLCPSGKKHGFLTYWPQGRMELVKHLHEGRIQPTAALLDIANSCNLCGCCDKQCNFATQLRPEKVARALKDYVDTLDQQHLYSVPHDDILQGLREIVGEKWATNDPCIISSYIRSIIPLQEELNFYVVMPENAKQENMVIAVVGDVDPAEVQKHASRYFDRLPRRGDPPPVVTVEPRQNGQRRFVLRGDTQPVFGVGYHRPAETHPDDAALTVLAQILGDGRTSRLYKRMVKDEKSALDSGAFNGFPGTKYPNLLFVYSIPNAGHTCEQMEKSTFEEIEKMKKDLVSEEELARIKTRTPANFIRSLESNSGLAQALAGFETTYGDWRKLLDEVAWRPS